MDTSRAAPRTPHNGPLTVIAVLLGFLVIDRIAAPAANGLGPAQASAQVRSVRSNTNAPAAAAEDEPGDSRTSAAQQRKQIIAALRSLGQRLDHLDALMAKGLSVKVTEMPEMKLPKGAQVNPTAPNGN